MLKRPLALTTMGEERHTKPRCGTTTAATHSQGTLLKLALLLLTLLLGFTLETHAIVTSLGCKDGSCYVYHTDRVTWDTARAQCRQSGRGRLAIISDFRVQQNIGSLIGSSTMYVSVWVGARNTGNSWTWQDGRSFYGLDVDYYDDPSARCAYLYTGLPGRTAAASCRAKKKFLCTSIGGSVPVRSSVSRTWYEANHDCASRQKVLPMLSQYEMSDLADRLSLDYDHDEYWIGLCRQGWIWQDTGEAVLYTHFSGNTPYCTQNKCMAINRRAEWFNEDCSSRRGFICEMPESRARTTYVPPTYRPPTPAPYTLPPYTPKPYTPQPYTPQPYTLQPYTPKPYTHQPYTPAPAERKTTTLEPHAVGGGDVHSHVVLIGVIVGLGVVITGLIVLIVCLVLRKRRRKKTEENDNIDNIYSEIREPPASLPQPQNPALDNLYLDNPSPCPSPRGSPKPKPRTKPMPLPKPDNLKPGCEMSTFKNHNPKRLSMGAPSVPPPDHPPPEQPKMNGACVVDATGPYAVSYIACNPKDKSATLDSLAALPEAPKPPKKVINGRLVLPPPPRPPPPSDEASRYLLPKKNVGDDTAAHGHLKGGQPRKGLGNKGARESVSLMLEENDLYSDGTVQ